jgi:hypothetical protein
VVSNSRPGMRGVIPSPWGEYVDLLRGAGDLNALTFAPEDDQLRADLYRQLTMNVALAYFMYFQSDATHPDWTPFLNSVFLLQPNPDDTYFHAYVDPTGTYRIVGERGTIRLLTMSMGRTAMGLGDRPGPSLGYVDFDRVELGPNGEIDVLLSVERPAGHGGTWVALPRDADYLLLRSRSYDWGNERDARIAIERIDAPAIKPKMGKAEIDRRLREVLGGFPRRLSAMWLNYQNTILGRGLVNQLEMTDFGGAVPNQWYWQGLFELGGVDDALILETDLPVTRRYWNVQLNDELFNAVDYVYRQSSLNGHQARIDADGKFRAVISMRDPGVHNWLDPGETRRGMLIGRWLDCDSRPVPTLTKVPFASVREHLPPQTVEISEAERAAQLRARRIGSQLRRRW